jgi:acyl-coenzyme A thioesterase PaaI-like protein
MLIQFARKLFMRFFPTLIGLWPPYLGAGIRVHSVDPDFRTIDVKMKLHFWNTNYVGTHFGGSLYAMCDPFFMFILMENLGRGYIVWDKGATIRFKKPGTGTVSARFHIPHEKIEEIRAQVETTWKVEPTFTVEIKNEQGEVVAEVDKLLYVRKKKAKPLAPPSVENQK